jgi:hypothetical protein
MLEPGRFGPGLNDSGGAMGWLSMSPFACVLPFVGTTMGSKSAATATAQRHNLPLPRHMTTFFNSNHGKFKPQRLPPHRTWRPPMVAKQHLARGRELRKNRAHADDWTAL